MLINLEEVDKIAHLAKLSFSNNERETLAVQLANIVEYMEKLDELDTSDVKPTSHVLDLKNVFREDIVENWLTQAEVLQNAPVAKKGYFSVPKVINNTM